MFLQRKQFNNAAAETKTINVIALVFCVLVGLFAAIAGNAGGFAPMGLWKSPETVPSTNISIGQSKLTFPTGPIDEPAATTCLNNWMAKSVPSTPLKDQGATFVSAGKDKNVNPALMIAIGHQESSLGTAGVAVSGANFNYFGMTATTDQTNVSIRGVLWRVFSNFNESISFQANYLNQQYLAQGMDTIEKISQKYAPVGAGNDPNNLNNGWVNGVKSSMNSIINSCTVFNLTPMIGNINNGASSGIIDFANSGVAINRIGNGTSHPITTQMKWEIYRSSNAQVANAVADAAMSRVLGKWNASLNPMPNPTVGSTTLPDPSGTEQSYVNNSSYECKAIVYFAIRAAGLELKDGADPSTAGLKLITGNSQFQKGDIIHFLSPWSPYHPGVPNKNGEYTGHWAVAD